MVRVHCASCSKRCKDKVIQFKDSVFHPTCFVCNVCKKQLSGGFFVRDGKYLCAEDYQRQFGVKCAACGRFVEGELRGALGLNFHKDCFSCARCRHNFAAGEKVTNLRGAYYCETCFVQLEQPAAAVSSAGDARSPASPAAALAVEPSSVSTATPVLIESKDLVDAARRGQTLPASGGAAVTGAGTRAASGRAGGTLNMSRGCTATLNSMGGLPLGDGPQLYSFLTRNEQLMAEASSRGGTSAQQALPRNMYHERGAAATLGGAGRPAGSAVPPKSPPSFVKPLGLSPQEKTRSLPLTAQTGKGILGISMTLTLAKRTVEGALRRSRSRSGSRSPTRNAEGEAAIRESKFPDALPPEQSARHGRAPIERDDFPGPVATALIIAEKQRVKRRSEEMLTAATDAVDAAEAHLEAQNERRTRESYDQLVATSQGSGLAALFCKELLERERERARKQRGKSPPLDPVSSSRVPNAASEPPYKTRYESPMFASPSRVISDVVKQPENYLRTAFPASRASTLPLGMYSIGSHGRVDACHFLPAMTRPGYTFGGGSSYREAYAAALSDPSLNLSGRAATTLPASAVSSFSPRYGASSTATPRRVTKSASALDGDDDDDDDSLMRYPHVITAPAMFGVRRARELPPRPLPCFPYEELRVDDVARLPRGVNASQLEAHLKEEEFERVFGMSRGEFVRLPLFKRNDLKKLKGLFH